MSRLLLAVACLAVMGAGRPPAGGARLALDLDGQPVLTLPGKADVRAHLFTHYDGWVWRGTGGLRQRRDGVWAGKLSKMPHDGNGRIDVRATERALPDGLRLTYEFTRRGPMDLRRGVFLALSFPLADYTGRGIVFTHGPPAKVGADFSTSARGCTVNLSDEAALRIECAQVTRFTTWVGENGSFDLNVRIVPDDFEDHAVGSVTLRLGPPVPDSGAWRAPAGAGPLRIGGAAPDRWGIRRGEPVEFSVDLSASYDNPFDPDQVVLEAAFLTPSGRTERVPGFYWQGFEAEHEDGEELLAPSGEAGWRLRYTPREAGEYSATFLARDASGEVTTGPVTFRCTESAAPGFVRVGAEHAGGPRYLAFADGETFFAIGHNVTTYPADLDEAFRHMAAGGENYTRFWMWSAALGLEWAQPLGRYRMDEAWRLDRVLERAREHGIYIMLCLDTHQDFREGWPDNPYNAARGGPCDKVLDFFRDEEARAAYRKRLRYVIARWAHHPNLLCWEFVNEIEGFGGAGRHRDVVAAWHAEMARFVRELDVFGHPITTSLWTTEGWPELWALPEMDIVQSHRYANDPSADVAAQVADICARQLRDYPGKPHVFGEYGLLSAGGTAEVDPSGLHLHNGNWAALMSGAASNPVSWWHAEYIRPLRLHGIYRGLARFVQGEALAGRRWRPVRVRSIEYVRPAGEEARDLEFSGGTAGWDGPVPRGMRFVPGRDGSVAGREDLPRVLHGRAHSEIRSAFVFDLDCVSTTRFAVHVGDVCAGAVLEFRLDGEEVQAVDLPAGQGLGLGSTWREQWHVWQTSYDEWHGIDVPAGRHTVEIENTGEDWLQVTSVRLSNYVTEERPRLRVLGLAADDRILLWLQNTDHTWFNVRAGERIEPVPPTRVCLDDVPEGAWTVQWWDTRDGEVTRTARAVTHGGRLMLDVPLLERDVALKLVRPAR